MRARRWAASWPIPRPQSRLLQGWSTTLGLPHPPKRIEVYDNSHIQGTNAVGAMIVAGPDGFIKNQYRKFNIKSEGLTPGDDYAHDARGAGAPLQAAAGAAPEGDAAKRQSRRRFVSAMARSRHHRRRPRPAQRRQGDFRRPRSDRGVADGGGQGAGPRRRPRNPVHAGPRAPSSWSRATRCCISSSGCATRRIAS